MQFQSLVVIINVALVYGAPLDPESSSPMTIQSEVVTESSVLFSVVNNSAVLSTASTPISQPVTSEASSPQVVASSDSSPPSAAPQAVVVSSTPSAPNVVFNVVSEDDSSAAVASTNPSTLVSSEVSPVKESSPALETSSESVTEPNTEEPPVIFQMFTEQPVESANDTSASTSSTEAMPSSMMVSKQTRSTESQSSMMTDSEEDTPTTLASFNIVSESEEEKELTTVATPLDAPSPSSTVAPQPVQSSSSAPSSDAPSAPISSAPVFVLVQESSNTVAPPIASSSIPSVVTLVGSVTMAPINPLPTVSSTSSSSAPSVPGLVTPSNVTAISV